MEVRDSLTFVSDMIESIDKIIRYIHTVSDSSAFIKNDMLIDAVTRNYEIIGEAANKVPKSIKDKYPDVPWRQMYSLRNFAVHEYHTIDPQVLWEIAVEHLPTNKRQLEYVLSQEKVE
ncbi:DUF86 domain-containing protein [Telluribacter sp.]|jgi:uncharacterized protein with HEPN domain|uniref:HepT-like ribonuclease domain-containing protein n=1 Tax=Telluribacter sp. TaxID=1978767 RepID=UPI002E144359|nr:HepT-like ribonuclease domain-containing protein [Telluribacter sp.]